MPTTQTGGCNCGGVTFKVTGPLRDVIACHCGQCRKQTGLYYAATEVADDSLEVSDSGTLAWYRASDEAGRGFCNRCGSALFWKNNDSTKTSILAGSLDLPSNLTLTKHIFVADKGDFYRITDALPQLPQSHRT